MIFPQIRQKPLLVHPSTAAIHEPQLCHQRTVLQQSSSDNWTAQAAGCIGCLSLYAWAACRPREMWAPRAEGCSRVRAGETPAGDPNLAALGLMRAEAQALMCEICATCAINVSASPYSVFVQGANGQLMQYTVCRPLFHSLHHLMHAVHRSAHMLALPQTLPSWTAALAARLSDCGLQHEELSRELQT